MKTLSTWFRVNRAIGPTILSIALLGAFIALAMSTTSPTSQSTSTAPTVAAPACMAKSSYTGSFTGGDAPSDQAKQGWINFRQSLVPADYDTVTISGSNDTTGRTLTDATVVPQIATAMKTQTAGSWTVGSITWTVGTNCSDESVCPHNGQVELTASPLGEDACHCGAAGAAYTVRPEICNENWGGVNTITCGGPSQTMTVTFSGPGAPSCAKAPAGMISWWKAEGNANDSEDGNNGTLQNGVTFAPGEVGQAFSFDGSGGVDVPDADNLDVTTAFTLDAWVNTTDLSDYPMLFSKFNSGNASYELHLQPDGSVRSNVSGNGTSYDSLISGPGVVTTGSWYHVTTTFNAGDWKIYVNGVQVAAKTSTVTSIFAGTADLFIGRDVSTHLMNGLIDEAEIFNRALSGAEVLSIYNGGCTGKCSCTEPPANMVDWWPANGNALDIKGGHHGTLHGNATFGSGEVSQAFKLDGNGDYVDVGDVDLPITFSIDAWINPTSLANSPYIITKSDLSTHGYHFSLFSDGHLILAVTNDTGGSTAYKSVDPVIATGSWQHVSATYDGNAAAGQRIKLFVNGSSVPIVVIVDDGGTPANNAVSAKIGVYGDLSSGYFNGLIDEVEIFSRVLSTDEIAAIYNAAGAGKCKSSTCIEPPTGMVSWWPAEGDANDIQDGNDGTFNGTPAYSSGEVGQAFSFNGVATNYVSVPHNANLDLTQFTVDAWIYPTTDSSIQWVVDKGDSPNGINYALALTSDHHVEFDFAPPAVGHQSIQSTDSVPANAWTHITGTYDGTTSKLYINGGLNNSQAFGSTPTGGQPIRIGLRASGLYAFQGLIDEVEVFDHALTDAEVLGIYTAGSAGKCKPQSTPTPTPTPTATPTATPTTTPTATPTAGASPHEVTGAGTILGPNSGQASFRMQVSNQKIKKKTQTIGSFSYSDPASSLSFSANKVAGLTFNGNQVHFTGTAKIGKRKASFSVDATDNGQPGTPNDIFSMSVSNGYSASGHLTSGDILIQQ